MNHIVLNVLLNWWCIQFGVVPGSYASAVAPVYYQQRQGNNLSIISLRLLVLGIELKFLGLPIPTAL